VFLCQAGRDGVWPHDDRVRDRDDLGHRQIGARSVLADRLGARRLVDANGPEPAGLFGEDVAADPADVGRHLVVADRGGAGGGFLQVAPAAQPSRRMVA